MYNVWYGGTLTSLVLRVCCITAVPPLIGMSGATCMLYYSCTSSHWHVWCYVCVVLQLYLLSLACLVLRLCCITAVPPLIGMSGATCMLYYSCTSSHWHVWCYVCVVLQLYLLSLACLVLRLCCITAVPLSLACLVLRVCCITAVPHWPVSARVALMRNQLCFT